MASHDAASSSSRPYSGVGAVRGRGGGSGGDNRGRGGGGGGGDDARIEPLHARFGGILRDAAATAAAAAAATAATAATATAATATAVAITGTVKVAGADADAEEVEAVVVEAEEEEVEGEEECAIIRMESACRAVLLFCGAILSPADDSSAGAAPAGKAPRPPPPMPPLGTHLIRCCPLDLEGDQTEEEDQALVTAREGQITGGGGSGEGA